MSKAQTVFAFFCFTLSSLRHGRHAQFVTLGTIYVLLSLRLFTRCEPTHHFKCNINFEKPKTRCEHNTSTIQPKKKLNLKSAIKQQATFVRVATQESATKRLKSCLQILITTFRPYQEEGAIAGDGPQSWFQGAKNALCSFPMPPFCPWNLSRRNRNEPTEPGHILSTTVLAFKECELCVCLLYCLRKQLVHLVLL